VADTVKPTSPREVQQLYAQHCRGLFAYACSVTGAFASAEDAVHEVFERLLRGDVVITGSAAPYLYRAVRNAALNHRRTQAREASVEGDWLEGPHDGEDVAFELQSVLRELPEEQREIVILHIWGQMSFDEAASALGISPNTAASRYRYGLTKLREQFQVTMRKNNGQRQGT
jgi:RNA polymerase sigma-70 factor (ECF subfamily)